MLTAVLAYFLWIKTPEKDKPKTCNKPGHVQGYKLASYMFPTSYLQRGWTSQHLLPPTILQMPLYTQP